MTTLKTARRGRVLEVIEKYGKCVDLISMDPHFHEITIGLYVKDGTSTVWTFSQKPDVEQRIEQIRDQLVELGDMVPVEGTHNQARFPGGETYNRPLRFLLRRAVEKPHGTRHPEGRIEIKDLRSSLQLIVTPEEVEDRWVYHITTEGEYKNPRVRVRAVVKGFLRYGEMEQVGDFSVAFPHGGRRDGMIRLILPNARNVTGTADMLEAEALRGQMTTGTLGFAQT
jgi:hypothetical protein